jgi:ABC-type molybdate transport system substrate-binding protein
MRSTSAHFRAFALGIASVLWLTVAAGAAEVRVMISGGLSAAYNALVPEFERATGHKVITAYGPSMGTTANAIPVRLERGEPADVLILVGYALGDLIKQGKVVPDSRVDLVKSKIGVAVKSGSPKPDISSPDALKRALLAAKSVDEGQGQEDSRHAGRRNCGPWRCRDRISAIQRIETRRRHRHCRAAAGRAAEGHGVFRRDCQRVEGT